MGGRDREGVRGVGEGRGVEEGKGGGTGPLELARPVSTFSCTVKRPRLYATGTGINFSFALSLDSSFFFF